MEEINSANTVEALLKEHKLVTITASYSHLAEGSDYTTTRQIKKDKKGNYFSYFKKEGSDDDYKEVISNKELYRYNGKYTQYFGLVGNDYEEECVKAIEDSNFSREIEMIRFRTKKNVIVQSLYSLRLRFKAEMIMIRNTDSLLEIRLRKRLLLIKRHSLLLL